MSKRLQVDFCRDIVYNSDMKEEFYIFLDIDGVLWDWDFIKSKSTLKKNNGIIVDFNPESVSALNYLIESLSDEYQVCLVITSTWRRDMLFTKSVLKKNDLIYDGIIDSTPISLEPNHRAKEVLTYMHRKNITDKYVIIDDEYFDYMQYFSKNNIIKTDLFSHSLDRKDVSTYLNQQKNNVYTL